MPTQKDSLDPFGDPFGDPKQGHVLTRAIIDTIREPLIVLDGDLRVIAASKSFYTRFRLTQETSHGKLFYELSNGQWNIPRLRTLLEQVITKHRKIEGYEIEHSFPSLGHRIMLLNAREIEYENNTKKMLLSIFDVTKERLLEMEREKLITQKDMLLKEMRHRIANSLQLIASILLLKAGTVNSSESRAHLEDAHDRILSIATIQQQLEPVGEGEGVVVGKYLDSLCKSLARSIIGDRKPITLSVEASRGTVTSDMAVSLGLITTELVINALKHGFPNNQAGNIIVKYKSNKDEWSLSVQDNGVGQSSDKRFIHAGLGTSIIGALANQLHALIETESSSLGTLVSVKRTAIP